MAIGKNIKGITIEFSGDTTKLGKAMESIRKDAKSVDTQLKQVNNALKFNPKNTELLAQKQQLLGQKVDLTKNKLNALREAQAKMDADPSVDKTSQDYMELRREIIVAESQLRNFTKQLKEVENIKFTQVGEGLQKIGGKMQTVGKGMTKYVTGPIVAAGAAATAAFNEVQKGLNIVTQKTGATGEALAGMQESVKNIAKTVPADFETIGAAVGEVNTRFGLQGQELEDLSGQFVKFAKLNSTDVSTSIDQVQKAMTAFGVPVEEASDMLDLLNKVGQNTGVSMDTLTQSLVANAPALQSMGFTANQAATFLGQLEVSGVDSTKVMTGLQKALVNGAKAGKTMPEVMSEIQQSIVGATNETDAMNAATKIFGAKAGPAIATAARNGALDFDSLASSVTHAEGSLNETFENTLTPAEKFQTTMNALKVTGYEIANTVLPMIQPVLDKISTAVQNLAAKWKELSPETQKMILIFAGIAAAIGPVLIVIGKLATGIGAIIKILPMLGSAFTVLTGPVGLVIAAIAAAIAIGVLLYKNWDKIKEKAGKLKEYVIGAFKALKEGVKRLFGDIKDAMIAPIEAARDAIKGIIKKIKGFFDFDFKLPDLKTPHFTIDPPGWSIGDLLHGVIPDLNVDWYAKGGIFRSPSVIGVGEAGPEAVLPIDKLQGMLTSMADSIVNGILMGGQLQAAGTGGEIVIKNYLYPSGPQMGEQTVKMYDQYKRILG